MKFKPLHDRVLIEVLDGSEKTAGGIIIPDTAQEKPQEGKVVAIGGGAKTEDGKIIPMDVKVGDKVLFGKWSGTEVKINDALGYDLIISFGYKHIIKKEVISNSNIPIINLHISYLPWNKGAHLNFWSFNEI